MMNDNDMQRMQQEAVRRTQEMQRRAAAYSRSSRPHEPTAPPSAPITPPDEPQPSQQEIPQDEEPIQPIKQQVHNVSGSGKKTSAVYNKNSGGIFETLFKDKEKTLILGILLLLMDEKTDNGLLMALMYLLI